jgi:hypothetical protein
MSIETEIELTSSQIREKLFFLHTMRDNWYNFSSCALQIHKKKRPFFFLSGSVLIIDFLSLVGFFCELIVTAYELALCFYFPFPLDVKAMFALSLLFVFKHSSS